MPPTRRPGSGDAPPPLDLQALADAAAAALPDPPPGAGTLEASTEPSVAGLASLRERWRAMGFDERTALDARATLAKVREPGALEGFGATDLPRISVDLPGSDAGAGEAAPRAPTPRPDLEVLGVLGEGGMGRVLLARQRSLDREVAVKTLRDRAPSRYREALLEEGAVTGHLEHPSIIPVHALGLHDDGRPVLVMKRVDGVSWHALLQDAAHPAWEGWGGTPEDRLEGHLEILIQVCNAVHFAHSRGVVHRDIKPANVLIGRFGDVYLADWGLAHRAGPGAVDRVCGTPGYMAPEMALGLAVDGRTDVYLLGAVLHEVLTGTLRHGPGEPTAMMARAVASAPVVYGPGVPAGLAVLANRATARDPGDRPATAAEFRKALAEHLRHRSSAALAASALPRLDRLRALEQDPDQDRAAQDQLLIEVRFALAQALEQWPSNPEARKASAELEALLAARRARSEALERLARDLDPTISERQRNWVMAGLSAVVVAVALPLVVKGPGYQPSPRELCLVSLVPTGAVVLLLALLRRHVLASAVNRRSAFGTLLVVSSVSLSRLLGLRQGLGAPAMLLHDALLIALTLAMGAFTVFPWLGWLALPMLLAAAACALWPAWSFLAFSAGTAAAVVLGLERSGLLRRRRG
ncbi:MAG: serine/threonine-protein kinase [Holophagaceae bacterium]